MAKSDIATILAKIDDIVEEIRELRRAPILRRIPLRLEDVELNSIQEKAFQLIVEQGEMTSLEVANVLNRTRPLMVINLNQLVALGLVEKVRRGRHVYFRRRQSEPLRIIVGDGLEENGCYLFVTLVSDDWPRNMDDVERVVSERLKDIPDWRVEHVAILPRPLVKDAER